MSLTKPFYEVFPTLKLEGEEHKLFSLVGVKKISTTRNRDVFHVYIQSQRLISQKMVRHVAAELAKQLFPRQKNVRFLLHESFQLSDQYTPQTLLDVYSESIASELKRESPILYNLYRHAEFGFSDDNIVNMELQDTIIAREESEKLADYLTNVMNVRCGLRANIRIFYRKEERSQEAIEAEIRVQHEIAAITEAALKAAGNVGELEEKKDTAKKGENAKGSAEKSSEKKSFGKKNFERREGFSKKANNPDIIYGRDFDEEAIPIKELVGENSIVVIRGQLIGYEEHPIRGERNVISIDITDFTDSITMKLFIKNEDLGEFREAIGAAGLEKGKPGQFVKVKGLLNLDSFEHDIVLSGIRMIKKIGSFVVPRNDVAPVKRVELHCHTRMSEMDGLSDVKTIVKRADSWGWNSIAITDHGNVLAFPEANHTLSDLSNPDFKIIYGVEGYLVDDQRRIIWDIGTPDGRNSHGFNEDYVVFDIETTGFSPEKDKIIEIGAVRVSDGKIVDHYDEFINPEIPIPFRIEELTGINDSMVAGAGNVAEVLPGFLKFCEGAHVVAHNAEFDTTFIAKNARDLGLPFDKFVVDTVEMARMFLRNMAHFKLDQVAKELDVSLENHHRAVDDAECTAQIFVKLEERAREAGYETFEDMAAANEITTEMIMNLPMYHVIILAKNEIGRVNLYRLVSMSYLTYYRRRPRIPKSVLNKYREGLIVGSACEAGELYQAIERSSSEDKIARIVNFYDYLEIQPIGNNEFLLKSVGKKEAVYESEEDLRNVNRKIVALGEQFNKPVVATCDVHFLDPADEVYRRIVMAGKGFEDADDQPPLYLRTTDEMLDEFMYLGEDKAREVVITNTNLIADMIDKITPVRPDKAPPVIENSDQTLRDICYEKAKELYGEDLPHQVSDRLEIELKSIIGNGYAVMYVIAQKLVWKSVEDGYLVGSRGSVGSSFVANMAGITEVNSLPAHYLCPKCHYYDFESEVVKDFQRRGMSGCDMPDAICPRCGEKLGKTGFDIPFETFLGFSGDKEPDIDLNFSGDYQSKAHKYTEVIFGAGQTFRAGTIGTMAEKTAYGYVLKYCEEKGIHKRRAEMERLAHGCEGVLRTTGQHPGGIVVMPRGEEIYSFTPIQHPANDMTTPIITTHFEYHSIDHNLLKLDILGHDDPTMIKFLQDATGVDPIAIPLDDKKVMSLFTCTDALGVTPEDIGGCKTGTLGIPEYGTDFAIQMLLDTQPVSFSDLIRISGLSHGTDVYAGNAELLIKEKGLKLAECICCRDDIMIYLIAKGMDPALSFKTMESVRKGKGLKPEMKEAMLANDVPDWYIESCLKIKYMFPKAHAAAYVMMAWRVAWFKVYKPLAYYSAFFSIRASKIDYETMCQGRGRLDENLKVLQDKMKEVGKNRMTATELDAIRDMRLVQEMYARGFGFEKIDINKADAKYFRQASDTTIMPPLSSVDGLGGKAADALANAIALAADDGPFLSVDDFCVRTGCSENVAKKLKDLGLLGNIPDSNQLSIFDLML